MLIRANDRTNVTSTSTCGQFTSPASHASARQRQNREHAAWRGHRRDPAPGDHHLGG
jgi:hypothetical protein